jgi:hypothetical protein
VKDLKEKIELFKTASGETVGLQATGRRRGKGKAASSKDLSAPDQDGSRSGDADEVHSGDAKEYAHVPGFNINLYRIQEP